MKYDMKNDKLRNQITITPKPDFIEQLNDIIAPVTRAYSDPVIETVKFSKDCLNEDGTVATLQMTVRVKRLPHDAAMIVEKMNADSLTRFKEVADVDQG